MIKKEDLSEFLLNSYTYNINAIGKDDVWGEVALNMKPLSQWEKFHGFNLFRNASFIAEVNKKMGGYKPPTIDTLIDIQEHDYNKLLKEIEQLKEEVKTLKTQYGIIQEMSNQYKQFNDFKISINEYYDYIKSMEPKINAQAQDITPFIEKVEKIWKKYLNKTDNDMMLIEIERRLNKLEAEKGK